ncbi:MAG: four helix bundle protein [Flavobacteriales bacterium]|jgi:four helix bundle protein|nr:four helix bundle protein [Flavobacteriales bacterium]MBK6892510.1 four helix bundle protein [Flavobacteriales bacterium]MBK7246648.1 four helix bundle protein [Flavobacteriales bacterium]MBK9061045.1 four helix bundle protein [Flavobacteriales bacterium]MBK9597683.1 four helix bundle protein [Flavobacteriales bacterium]
MERKYDLDDRCVEFGAQIVLYTDKMPRSVAGNHLAKQLLRSGTAPALHYGEVQGSESTADFIHKMRLALKELRESRNNMRIQAKAELMDFSKKENAWLLNESVELVAIFAASVKTAERNRKDK